MSRPESVAGLAPNPSHAPRPLPPKSRSLSPSNISLFVSNLRLLNLDQRQDWPDITVRTFDTKDALQNQKKRVSCVEWSLYRLFEIWDRETTRDKLQPFFPPLESIQSLNLRAALFRCLNDLKKNDVLGREATLRKTMLDDCKGEKFEEVLLLFSAAVVRKQVLSIRRKQLPSIGKNVAVAKSIEKRELSTIGPLSLAYRASLAKTLQSRVTLDLTLNKFRTSLYEKTNEYHQRHLTLLETQNDITEILSPETEKSIRRELLQNWVGSIEGCDALLAGAKIASADAYMDSSFDGLWKHFQQGTTPQVPPESISLLEALRSRVVEQNDRLRLWKAYRDVFEGTNKPTSPDQISNAPVSQDPTAAAHGLDIFNKHRNICVEQTSSETADYHTLDPAVNYDQVVQDMRLGLSEIGKKKQRQRGPGSHHAAPTPLDRLRRTNTVPRQAPIPVFLAGSKEPKDDLFSPLKRPLLESTNSTPITMRDEPRKTHVTRTYSQPAVTPQSVRSEYDMAIDSSIKSHHDYALRQSEFAETSLSVQRDRDRYLQTYTPDSQSESGMIPRHETTPQRMTHFSSAASEHPDSAEDPITSLEHEIEGIDLEERQRPLSISDLPDYSPPASSSPPAPTSRQQSPRERPNLSERARISIASFRSSENSHPLPQPTPDAPASPTDPGSTTTAQSRRTSLADRALASLTQASLLPHPQRRTTTKERPLSSFFPSTATTTTAQFSTPIKKGRTSLVGTRDTTPRDKLFEQDAEYASVFKSRPKIAMSPVLSPGQESAMEEAEEFSFEGGDIEESMMGLESSPLGKFGM